MSTLKLYGTESPNLAYIRSKILEFVHFHGIELNIEGVAKIQDFVQEKLESVPAFSIDDNAAISRNNKGVHDFILEACRSIIDQVPHSPSKRVINALFDAQDDTLHSIDQTMALTNKNMYIIQAVHVVDPYSKNVEWVHPRLNDYEQHFIGDFHHLHIIQPIKFAKGKCKNSENPCAGCICSPPLHAADLNIVLADSLSGWLDNPDSRLIESIMHPKCQLLITSQHNIQRIHGVLSSMDIHHKISDVVDQFLQMHHQLPRTVVALPLQQLSSIHDNLIIVNKHDLTIKTSTEIAEICTLLHKNSNHLLAV
jgi:hypothetical protein